jgi:hypothetical protein
LRIAPLFVPIYEQPNINTPLAQLLFHWLNNNPVYVGNQFLLSSFLVFFQALLLNYISTDNSILYKDSLLPGLFFVIINSIYPQQLILSPQMIANSFLLLMLFRICYLYDSESPILLVFDIGVLLGIGLQFNYDMLVYLPFILVSIITMTSFNFRYLLVAIIGIIVPAYFLGVIFYLTDQFGPFIQSFEYSIQKSYFNTPNLPIQKLTTWISLMPPFVFSIFQLQGNYFRNRVKTRRLQLTMGILLLFGIFSLYAENQSFIYAIPFLSSSLALAIANYFISHKRFWLKELLLFSTLTTIVLNHYFNN